MNEPSPPPSPLDRVGDALRGLRAWFRAEADEVKASVDDLTDRADAELGRRERELEATPSERIEMIRAETDGDDLLDEVRRRLDGG